MKGLEMFHVSRCSPFAQAYAGALAPAVLMVPSTDVPLGVGGGAGTTPWPGDGHPLMLYPLSTSIEFGSAWSGSDVRLKIFWIRAARQSTHETVTPSHSVLILLPAAAAKTAGSCSSAAAAAANERQCIPTGFVVATHNRQQTKRKRRSLQSGKIATLNIVHGVRTRVLWQSGLHKNYCTMQPVHIQPVRAGRTFTRVDFTLQL